MVTQVPEYPGTRVLLTRRHSNAKWAVNSVWDYTPGTRLPVSAGTRVPGSGSALTAPHRVGYPVPNFEAGLQLYWRVRLQLPCSPHELVPPLDIQHN